MPSQGIFTLSGPVTQPETRAEAENLLACVAPAESDADWDRLTGETIIEWGWRYAGVDDGDIQWPTREVLTNAYHVARNMREKAIPAPSRIVPDGEGGVAFEWQNGPTFVVLEMSNDRAIELLDFRNAKLVRRKHLPPM